MLDFSKFFDVIGRQRHSVVVVAILGIFVFFAASIFLRKYQAQSTILAASTSPQQSAALDPSKDPTTGAVSPSDLPALAVSAPVLDRVLSDLHIRNTAQNELKLAKKIKMKAPLVSSNFLPITFTARNPSVAIAGANAVARELEKYDSEIATARYDQLIRNLEFQLADRRRSLQARDREISNLAANDPYLISGADQMSLDTHRLQLEQQRATLAASVRGDEASIGIVEKRPDLARRLSRQEIIEKDPVFDALKMQYGKDLAQYNNESSSYSDRFMGLRGLKLTVSQEHRSLTSAIDQETSQPDKSATYVSTLLDSNRANSQLANDSAALSSIDAEIATESDRLSSANTVASRVAALRRDQATGDAAYGQLQNRLTQAIVDREQARTINTIVIVETARYAKLTAVSEPLVIGLATLVLFTWLAISLAYYIDKRDVRLRTPSDIEELYGVPVFGAVG